MGKTWLGILSFAMLVSVSANSMSGKVLYQVLIDRFASSAAKPCSAIYSEKYCGGDLKGLQQHLDYVKALGVDGILMTSLFENTPTSFLGYSVLDFYALNSHFGTFADLEAVVTACRDEGLMILADLVVNNVAAVKNVSEIHPFNLEEYYHPRYSYCTPDPLNYNVTRMTNCWIGDLPDLDQDHPFVRSQLQAIAKAYTDIGIEGFRVTTAWGVPQSFLQELTANLSTFTIAEVPFDKVDFAKEFQGPASSVLNSALSTALRLVFQKQDSFSVLSSVVKESLTYPSPELVANYLDTPDSARFSSYTSQAGYKNALAWILTFPGIPVLYYGNEQVIVGEPQAPLWPNYNQTSVYFKFIETLLDYRKKESLWTEDWDELQATSTHYVAKMGNTLLVFTNTEDKHSITVEISGQYCELYSGNCVDSQGDKLTLTTQGEPLIYAKKKVTHDDDNSTLLLLSSIIALVLA